MISWLKQLFKSESPVKRQTTFENFVITDYEGMKDYPNAIQDIYERKYNGIIVKNALKPEVLQRLADKVNTIYKDKFFEVIEGFYSYPKTFNYLAAVSQELDREKMKAYFDECAQIVSSLETDFDQDIEGLVMEYIKGFSGGKPIRKPILPEGQLEFAPFSFRYYVPPSGRLDVHCGNLFIDYFAGFYNELAKVVQVRNQLSFFFLLQKPEEGGDLVLYDLEWDNAKEKIGENNKIKSVDGEQIHDFNDPETLPRSGMGLEAGDLILFAGGQIWHKIAPVGGSVPRQTLGGFLSFTEDQENVVIWS